jgi:putative proteasome-type protease
VTYCLGIALRAGLVMASDSRSNAGVDQVTQVRKQAVLVRPGERVVIVLSAGNLATTQAVVSELRQGWSSGRAEDDLTTAASFSDIARMVGDRLRAVIQRDAKYVEPYGDATGSFIVGGQIAGEPARLFQIYSAGNFIEADERSFFLQIGETKYGKPILDRALGSDSSLDEAAKLALLSFDATLRSNLSVGPPIDLIRYATDSLDVQDHIAFDDANAYWTELRTEYGRGLGELVQRLPAPPSGARETISAR